MRDSVNHEEIYFQFVLKHDILKHIYYTDNPIINQKVIGIIPSDGYTSYVKQLMTNGGVTIIDPNYDEIYNSFIALEHNLDSIEYIKNKIENSSREQIVEFTINNIKKLLSKNILAEEVYIIVYPDWPTDWLDKVIEV